MHFSCQCKANSISGMLLHLTEGPAQLNAEYWFSYIQGAITLSEPHKVKGFGFGLLASHCILSAHNVLHLCIPACATSKEVWLSQHLVSQKLDCIGSSCKRNENRQRGEKHYSVPWLLWAGWSMFSFVEVSGCMSPRLHPSFVLSLFFLCQITHPHIQYTLSSSSNTARDVSCWWLAVEGAGRVDAVPPQEAAAICFKSGVLSNGGGGSGEVGRGWRGWVWGFGGSTEEKWSPSCKG